MSRTINKILALSIALLILLSGLIFLGANKLTLAEESATDLKEPVVEGQALETETSQKTSSKVASSKDETTKEVTTQKEEAEETVEVEESLEEVSEEEKPNIEVPMVKVPVMDVPEEEAPEIEVPMVKVPVMDVPEEEAPEAEVPMVEIPVMDVPEEEAPEAEVPMVEIPVTDVPEEEEPKFELPMAKVPVTVKPKIELPMAKVPVTVKPKIELPMTKVQVSVKPKIEVPMIKVPVTVKPKIEVPMIEVPVTVTPEAEIPMIEIPIMEVPQENSVDEVQKLKEFLFGANLNEDAVQMTEPILDDSKATTKVIFGSEDYWTLYLETVGSANEIGFAKFECDTDECVGFENGVSSYFEGRRGGTQMKVEAPDALEGYEFEKWTKRGTILVSVDVGDGGDAAKVEIPVDVYKAEYKSTASVEDSVENPVEVPEVKTALLKEKITDVSSLEQNSQTADTDATSDGDSWTDPDHKCYVPADNECTTDNGLEDEELTVTFAGCYHYVSFATFKCDLSKCKGLVLDNEKEATDTIEISRRGGTTATVKVLDAVEGYEFTGWTKEQKTTIKVENGVSKVYTIDYYTANFAPVEAK